MIRAGILAVVAMGIISGCKPSTVPLPIEQVPAKDTEQPNPRPPTPPKPYQTPILGNPDLENASGNELVQWLGHEDWRVRVEASDHLLAGGSEAIPLLIAALDDKNYHVRAGAAFSLGCLGPQAETAVSRLAELAEDDPWEAVRDAAKFALRDVAGQ